VPSSTLLFVDVDGVLNPDITRLAGGEIAGRTTAGYRRHRLDGTGPDGRPTTGEVWLRPDHGAWLAELAQAGAELVWATSRRYLANQWIAPRLGLSGAWPVVDITASGCASATPTSSARSRRSRPAGTWPSSTTSSAVRIRTGRTGSAATAPRRCSSTSTRAPV
jgi:hypothetical protein